MTRSTTFTIGLLAFIWSSCSNHGYELWKISKFNVCKDALEDNEPIKILYTTRSPDNNEGLNYYLHLIAVSQKTGDTVNVLTTANNGFSMASKDKIYNFFNQDNLITKLSQLYSDKHLDLRQLEEAKQRSLKRVNWVLRDPTFDEIADNNYPTMFGTIGVFYQHHSPKK